MSVYFAICYVQSFLIDIKDEEYRHLKDVKQVKFH